MSTALFCDSVADVAETYGLISIRRHNTFAVTRFETEETELVLDVLTSVDFPPAPAVRASLAVYINNVYQAVATVTTDHDVLQSLKVTLPAGNKTVEIWEGSQHDEGGVINGTFLHGIRGKVTFAGNPAPTRRLAIYHDSIPQGDGGTIPIRDGWGPRLRLVYPGRVSFEGWGSRTLNGDTVATLGQRLVDLVAGATTREIALEVGVGDYSANIAHGAYETKLGQLCDDIHSRDASARIFLQTLIPRPLGEGANGAGSTLANFQTAGANVQAARSSFVTLVSGTGMGLVGGDYADGVHLNDGGHTKDLTAWRTALSV